MLAELAQHRAVRARTQDTDEEEKGHERRQVNEIGPAAEGTWRQGRSKALKQSAVSTTDC